MTNYISYILLTRIKSSSLLKQLGHDLKTSHDHELNSESSLLKKIAREIFLQSESEPCGLKGCKISIYFEESEEINHLLSQFRFDSTSSLTTFELNLIIKKDTLSTSLTGNNSNNRHASSSSPFATLTRRILNRSKSKTPEESAADNSGNHVYLDSNNYVLLKTKLY